MSSSQQVTENLLPEDTKLFAEAEAEAEAKKAILQQKLPGKVITESQMQNLEASLSTTNPQSVMRRLNLTPFHRPSFFCEDNLFWPPLWWPAPPPQKLFSQAVVHAAQHFYLWFCPRLSDQLWWRRYDHKLCWVQQLTICTCFEGLGLLITMHTILRLTCNIAAKIIPNNVNVGCITVQPFKRPFCALRNLLWTSIVTVLALSVLGSMPRIKTIILNSFPRIISLYSLKRPL